MISPSINTLEVAKRFEQGGFSHEQAESLSEVLFETLDSYLEHFSTKEELIHIEQKSEHEWSEAFHHLDRKIDQVAIQLDRKIDRVAIQLDQKIDRVAIQLDRKIDQVAAHLDQKIERLDQKIEILQLSTKNDIASLDQKMDRRVNKVVLKLGSLMVAIFTIFTGIQQLFL